MNNKQMQNAAATPYWQAGHLGTYEISDFPIDIVPNIGDTEKWGYPPSMSPWIIKEEPQNLQHFIGTWASTWAPEPVYWRSEITSAELRLSCDLPGIKHDDLSVEIDAGTLKVSGVRRDTKEHIVRTWILGNMFDPTTADASLEDGVLRISFQKRPEYMPRQIKIKVK